MKYNFTICVITIFILLGFHRVGIAGGVGIFGTWGTGKNNFQSTQSIIFWGKTDNVRGYMGYGCGFIADTNLGTEKIFNYRFKIGYDYQVSDSKENKKMHRGMLSNTFGAAIYNDVLLRIWLGPQIGIGYYWGINRFIDQNFIYNLMIPYPKTASNINTLNLHLGLVLGINVNVTKSFALAFEGGLRFNMYYEVINPSQSPQKRMEDYFEVMGPEGYISLALMYRFKEGKLPDDSKIDDIILNDK
jgi:hypothetical protein